MLPILSSPGVPIANHLGVQHHPPDGYRPQLSGSRSAVPEVSQNRMLNGLEVCAELMGSTGSGYQKKSRGDVPHTDEESDTA